MNGRELIATVAKSRMAHRSMDTPIGGNGGYIGCGEHDVTIIDIDTNKFDQDYSITLTFEDACGSKHVQRIWVLNRWRTDYSDVMISLINAVFEDPSVIETFDTLMADQVINKAAFALFKGLSVKIKLEMTEGYTVAKTPKGFVIRESKTDDLLDPREFATIREAKVVAESKQYKRAWRQVKHYKAQSDEQLDKNRKKFNFALEGLHQAARTVGRPRQVFDITSFAHAAKAKRTTSNRY
jgi:hypothetical protein